MQYCPFCGRHLADALASGITTCPNCGRVFDSSCRNRLLSAAWLQRREHIYDPEILKFHSGLSDIECEVIEHYIIDLGYNHDEFLNYLNTGVVISAEDIIIK